MEVTNDPSKSRRREFLRFGATVLGGLFLPVGCDQIKHRDLRNTPTSKKADQINVAIHYLESDLKKQGRLFHTSFSVPKPSAIFINVSIQHPPTGSFSFNEPSKAVQASFASSASVLSDLRNCAGVNSVIHDGYDPIARQNLLNLLNQYRDWLKKYDGISEIEPRYARIHHWIKYDPILKMALDGHMQYEISEDIEKKAALTRTTFRFSQRNATTQEYSEAFINADTETVRIVLKDPEAHPVKVAVYGAWHDFSIPLKRWNKDHPDRQVSYYHVITTGFEKWNRWTESEVVNIKVGEEVVRWEVFGWSPISNESTKKK